MSGRFHFTPTEFRWLFGMMIYNHDTPSEFRPGCDDSFARVPPPTFVSPACALRGRTGTSLPWETIYKHNTPSEFRPSRENSFARVPPPTFVSPARALRGQTGAFLSWETIYEHNTPSEFRPGCDDSFGRCSIHPLTLLSKPQAGPLSRSLCPNPIRDGMFIVCRQCPVV